MGDVHDCGCCTREWLDRAVRCFQEIAGVLHDGRPEHIAAALSQCPAPRSPLEAVVLRCFAYDAIASAVAAAAEKTPDASCVAALAAVTRLRTAPTLRDVSIILQETVAARTPDGAERTLVLLVKRFVEQQCDGRITVRRVAHTFGVSLRLLNDEFRSTEGMALKTYIRHVRVTRGLRLIAQGMKIEAAALMVGYRSKKDFYRAVRVETGVTPGSLRPPVSAR
jgi:AraC-like DNA-binding protein